MGIQDLIFGKLQYRTQIVTFRRRKFNLEIADTFRKLSVGLMEHDGIGKDQGMLFIFGESGRHGIWMLHMKFSIDILWLDGRGKVLHIVSSAPACKSMLNCKTYNPNVESRFVVEMKAGVAKRLKIKVGDAFIPERALPL